MTVYNAPVQDMKFVLNDVLQMSKYSNLPGFADASEDVVEAILEEGAKMASNVLHPINHSGDKEGCTRHDDGSVTTPKGFKEAYDLFTEGGWQGLSFDPEYGGQGLPYLLSVVINEMISSSNMAFGMYPGLAMGAAMAIYAHGTDEQKQKYLPKMVSGEPGCFGPGIDRAFEECHPRLVPEPFPQKERRVHRGRQQRCRDQLGQVVLARKVFGSDLEMQLEAGVGRLEHHAVGAGLELVDAADVDREPAFSQGHEAVVELTIPGKRGHEPEAQVIVAQGRQDTGEQDTGAFLLRRHIRGVNRVAQIFLQLSKAPAAKGLRWQVRLEVELSQLGGEAFIRESVEHIGRYRCRVAAFVDQSHLLLGTDPLDSGFEHSAFQHLLERPQIRQHCSSERANLTVVVRASNFVLPHVPDPTRLWPGAAATATPGRSSGLAVVR